MQISAFFKKTKFTLSKSFYFYLKTLTNNVSNFSNKTLKVYFGKNLLQRDNPTLSPKRLTKKLKIWRF